VRRRIRAAIVGVTALVLVGLGVPLAIAVHESFLNDEVIELQAAASRIRAEVTFPLTRDELAAVAAEKEAPPHLGVYDRSGRLLYGEGPQHADALVTRTLSGDPGSSTDGPISVTEPITNGRSERVDGVVRVTESRASVEHRSRMAWLVMIGASLAAIGLAWVIGNALARRLSSPVTELAAAARRIGSGGSAVALAPSGIEEIDSLASDLAESADRVDEALARERRFSADVSHQLRTPLTGLRLRLESAAVALDHTSVDQMLVDVARLQATVEHLLDHARDATLHPTLLDLDHVLQRGEERWRARVWSADRRLHVEQGTHVSVEASERSVEQVLDILVDNALRHGRGTIDLRVRRLPGGAALDVTDEGDGVPANEVEDIFDRGHGDGLGIGLALARSLAEADGARLLLTRRKPPTFSLILLERAPDDEDSTASAAADGRGSPLAPADPSPAPTQEVKET
jgi:signal transduction histidine kinase